MDRVKSAAEQSDVTLGFHEKTGLWIENLFPWPGTNMALNDLVSKLGIDDQA